MAQTDEGSRALSFGADLRLCDKIELVAMNATGTFTTDRTKVRVNYILVDFENLPLKSLSLLQAEHFRVQVFLGPNNSRLPRGLAVEIQRLGARGGYVEMSTAGLNALDFHIAYHLGRLAHADPDGYFHIISKDRGFDPLIAHLKASHIFASRSESIEAMPCFVLPSSASVAPSLSEGDTDLIQRVFDDLVRRGASRPKTYSKLRNTVHSCCGKDRTADEIDAVIGALMNCKHVRIDGEAVSYTLPDAQP